MSGRPLSELAREITSGAVRLSAATAAWLVLVAEFDERGGWGAPGIRSCAHWLSWQCGLSMGAAREHVRVARALRTLPLTRAAFLEGRISYAEARALTRVAEPATEGGLLEFASAATASQTERALREIRRADRVDQRTVAERRQFDHWWDDDGMLVLRARLSPEEGADLLTAVQARAERRGPAGASRDQACRRRGRPHDRRPRHRAAVRGARGQTRRRAVDRPPLRGPGRAGPGLRARRPARR